MTTKPLRIWLNQTYATNYWVIDLLRKGAAEDGYEIEVFATSDKIDSPVLLNADHIALEPSRDDVAGWDYVEWAIQYAYDNKIDILIPMREAATISKYRLSFEAYGCKVLAGYHEGIDQAEDKVISYQLAQDAGIPVPLWRTATGPAELRTRFLELEGLLANEDVCIKPVHGVGGTGFKRISKTKNDFLSIMGQSDYVLDRNVFLNSLDVLEEQGKTTEQMMLLPWLDEPETSVDTLALDGKVLRAIPRVKDGKERTFKGVETEASVEIAHKAVSLFNLSYLSNTQTRLWHGNAVLLETNARISGGLFAASLTGVNLAWEAVMTALGAELADIEPDTTGGYAMFSTAVARP